jgi:phosphoserine phosphatase RsbU/P
MTTPPLNQPDGDRLSLLYHLSQQFNSSLDLDEVLNRVMDEVISAVRAERGFVMLKDQFGKQNFRVARGMDQKTIEDPEFQVSRSVIEKVAEDGEPILTSDAQSDLRFNMRQSVMAMGLRSILCAPLKIKDQLTGVIYVDNRLRAGIFTAADMELLSYIASSAAIAIENARLYQVAIEKGKLEQELQSARQVQAALLPKEIPIISGWEFDAFWQPAREVGGDYYDFIPLPGDRLGLVIADVTDKGMPAALFMASTKNIIRASAGTRDDIAEEVSQANRLIEAESDERMFVSLVCARLDLKSGIFNYVNAGHNPPLYYSKKKNILTPLERTGMWLGVDPNNEFIQQSITMDKGDFVLFYTDGVPDAINMEEMEFGMPRLEKILLKNASLPPEVIRQVILKGIADFVSPAEPFDDITLMIIKRI